MPAYLRVLQSRFALGVGVFALLCAVVLLSRCSARLSRGHAGAPADVKIVVSSEADRGPGSLREALFAADAADGKAQIVIRARKIALETPLPPLMNLHGIRIVADPSGLEIDAHALSGGAVFDIDSANVSIEGLLIRHCPAAAILLRASVFQLEATTVESCDVGVDVAENAGELLLAHNHFSNNRFGVRFAASSRNAVLRENQFSSHKEAGVWAVRGSLDVRDVGAISVHDNQFHGDNIGVIAANVSILLERNAFTAARTAAIHLIGAGPVVRANHISGGAATGIVVEDAHGALLDNNEIDNVTGYGILVRRSGRTLIQNNRIHHCGYGLAFVLGDAVNPSTAADNLLISQKYDAIDILGDSPILRHNRVLQTHAQALRVEDYRSPDGRLVRAHPFLDGNIVSTTTGENAGVAVTAAIYGPGAAPAMVAK
jgi:parallel beta-helix repeat protein